ncbi:MAG: hypothetical protein HZA51_04865 [Planctomycetes bacterium]|nr:hypothetical protein [Planctomycetota bacterium]
MIPFPDRDARKELNDGLTLIDRWYIAATGNGGLWVQPRKDVLSLREFCTLLKRIHRTFIDQPVNVLVFYFDGVNAPSSLWQIVQRLITALANSMNADCRIIQTIDNAAPPATGRKGAVSGSAPKATGVRTGHMTKLDGVSIVIKPRATATVRFGQNRMIA